MNSSKNKLDSKINWHFNLELNAHLVNDTDFTFQQGMGGYVEWANTIMENYYVFRKYVTYMKEREYTLEVHNNNPTIIK